MKQNMNRGVLMKIIDGGIEREMTSEEEKLCIEIQSFLEEQDKTEKIRQLKQELSDTDYKVIKSYEYFLAGKELPYDIDELHKERQTMRDEIESLESEV